MAGKYTNCNVVKYLVYAIIHLYIKCPEQPERREVESNIVDLK